MAKDKDDAPTGLDPKSRAYDPAYVPTKSLEQLVKERPGDQFLADRLAEQREAVLGNAKETGKKI